MMLVDKKPETKKVIKKQPKANQSKPLPKSVDKSKTAEEEAAELEKILQS